MTASLIPVRLMAKKSRTFEILAGDLTDLCCGLVWIFNTSFPSFHFLVHLSMAIWMEFAKDKQGWLRGGEGTRLSEA